MSGSSERGLGRGLGALIPRSTIGLREIPVEHIRPNPWQPRTYFDEQELGELAQSIREHGVLQPVLVSQQADGSFQLITGERRWRAVQLAGMPTIPAMVKEATPPARLGDALAREMNASRVSSAEAAPPDPDVERLEDDFRQALGTRVRLMRSRHGGRLVIHFFSDEELQGIYEAIVRR